MWTDVIRCICIQHEHKSEKQVGQRRRGHWREGKTTVRANEEQRRGEKDK